MSEEGRESLKRKYESGRYVPGVYYKNGYCIHIYPRAIVDRNSNPTGKYDKGVSVWSKDYQTNHEKKGGQ